MHELRDKIPRLPAPEFPAYFGRDEQNALEHMIMEARAMAVPYDGNFSASWLKPSFDSHLWLILKKDSYQKSTGEWVNVQKIRWGTELPDGSNLTDAQHLKLLDMCKKILFLIRAEIVGNVSAPHGIQAAYYGLRQLSKWTILHKSRYQPDKYGFSMVDQDAMNSLFAALAEGGWAIALNVPHRILGKVYQLTFARACPIDLYDQIYNLPTEVTNPMIEFLVVNGFYESTINGTYTGRKHVSRKRVGALIFESSLGLASDNKINAFLRQFEQEFAHPKLLLSIFQPTEYPSHRVEERIAVLEKKYSESSLQSAHTTISLVFSAHRHLSDWLPEPTSISIKSAEQHAISDTSASLHTPFIPVDTALSYLNSAIRFIHLFGDSIVDLYIAVVAGASKQSDANRQAVLASVFSDIGKEGFSVKLGAQVQPVTQALGIMAFNTPGAKIDFDLFRNHPTLHQTVWILAGACIICISMLKPSRQMEICGLERDCLRKNADGYVINFELAKSGMKENRQRISRPIPFITARAIQLLQKLGSGISPFLVESENKKQNLFCIPDNAALESREADHALLSTALNLFCDYCASPIDSLGRRWYVRIHEMRRWFLLMLFWSGRFDVLDAARWIAGHTDASHVYEYIEHNFSNADFPTIEAEYAVARLWDLDIDSNQRVDRANPGLSELYKRVLKHFKVRSLSMIPENEWIDYVTALRRENGFVLEPHSVRSVGSSEIIGINVSFVLRETPDE
jgi:hypothetical protein